MLSPSFYAHDIDMTFVSKYPPGIVAFVDVQDVDEAVSFAEVLGYNKLVATAPVYLVQTSDAENGPFTIFEYLGGDWRPEPPVVQIEFREFCKDWREFGTWEALLRRTYTSRQYKP